MRKPRSPRARPTWPGPAAWSRTRARPCPRPSRIRPPPRPRRPQPWLGTRRPRLAPPRLALLRLALLRLAPPRLAPPRRLRRRSAIRADLVPIRRGRGAHTPIDGLTVREMLGQDAMRGARIIAGAGGLDRVVRRLNVMTVPNIVRWTKQDEFLLTTGYPLPRQPADLPGEFCRLIEQLAANGLAGLGVKLDEYLAEVPPAAVELADQVGFPIVVIPASSPLDDVLSQTFETIVNRQAAALARRQQMHDAFLSVALTGGGLARLADELADLLPGADVVVCDPAGYPLAATTRSHAPVFRGPGGPEALVGTAWLIAGVHKDAATGTQWATGVIRAGDMRHGFVLAVGGPQGLPGVAGLAVEQAAL